MPGQQSAVYPGAPPASCSRATTGIARGLSPARFGHLLASALGVRLLAERQDEQPPRELRVVLHRLPGLSAGIMYGVPPYGYNYLSPAPPLFDTPFITAADGTNNGQRFPQQFPPLNASPSNPVTNIDWSQFLPVNADPFFGSTNKTPYSAQLHVLDPARAGAELVMTASYVGTRGTTCWCCSRRTRATRPLPEREPGEPGRAGQRDLWTVRENGVFTSADGTVINGTHGRSGPTTGSVTAADVDRLFALQRVRDRTCATPRDRPAIPGRLHVQPIGGRRRRISASR